MASFMQVPAQLAIYIYIQGNEVCNHATAIGLMHVPLELHPLRF